MGGDASKKITSIDEVSHREFETETCIKYPGYFLSFNDGKYKIYGIQGTFFKDNMLRLKDDKRVSAFASAFRLQQDETPTTVPIAERAHQHAEHIFVPKIREDTVDSSISVSGTWTDPGSESSEPMSPTAASTSSAGARSSSSRLSALTQLTYEDALAALQDAESSKSRPSAASTASLPKPWKLKPGNQGN